MFDNFEIEFSAFFFEFAAQDVSHIGSLVVGMHEKHDGVVLALAHSDQRLDRVEVQVDCDHSLGKISIHSVELVASGGWEATRRFESR